MTPQVAVTGSYSCGIRIVQPSGDQHLSVRQQRCRMASAVCVEVGGGAPCSRSRIVQLCAVGVAPSDQYLAVGQQCGSMSTARYVEAADDAPCLGGRVVQLRGIEGAEVGKIWNRGSTSRGPQRLRPFRREVASAVWRVRSVWRLPVTLHVPVAGSYSSALANGRSKSSCPPVTSTCPLGSSVAVGP